MINSTSGLFNSLPRDWREFLGEELSLEADRLVSKVENLGVFYPSECVFRAFHLCQVMSLKVVITGQDPYPGEGQANGLAFSVKKGVTPPPSLRNIFKELKADLGVERENCELDDWAEEGVLLLNAILTVKPNEMASHAKLGWVDWTDAVLAKISEKKGIVFILWGAYAKAKKVKMSVGTICIEGGHPSPLSANRGGFFGGKYFSKTNAILKEQGVPIIHWG